MSAKNNVLKEIPRLEESTKADNYYSIYKSDNQKNKNDTVKEVSIYSINGLYLTNENDSNKINLRDIKYTEKINLKKTIKKESLRNLKIKMPKITEKSVNEDSFILNPFSAMTYRKGILRWDSFTFPDKYIKLDKEFKYFKKIIRNKESIQFIKNYRKVQTHKKRFFSGVPTSDTGGEFKEKTKFMRRDSYGNFIMKGKDQHKLCFSETNEIHLVDCWKNYNKIDKSFKGDYG